MMEFLNWVGEHPVLSFLLAWVISYGVGQIGTHRTTIKIRPPKDRE